MGNHFPFGSLTVKRQAYTLQGPRRGRDLGANPGRRTNFEERGLSCLDITAQNKGHDFEIRSAEEVFFVELKTSCEQWSHWENSMTRNEFKSAIDNAENYILFVAERVHQGSERHDGR